VLKDLRINKLFCSWCKSPHSHSWHEEKHAMQNEQTHTE